MAHVQGRKPIRAYMNPVLQVQSFQLRKEKKQTYIYTGILRKSKVWIDKIKEYDTKLFTTNNWIHVSIKYAF